MKKVSISSKPTGKPQSPNADAWVRARGGPHTEAMKRLTIDVSLGLHARIKSQCALHNEQMADVIRDMLEKRFRA